MKGYKKYFKDLNSFCKLIIKISQKKKFLTYKYTCGAIRRKLYRVNFPTVTLIELPSNIETAGTLKVIASADRYCAGIYNILGSGDLKIDKIDWHKDYVSGKVWPKGTFYKDYKQEGIDDDSDVKWPREISRGHQFLHAAMAYRITGERKYSDYVLNQIQDWIDENPLMKSINWGCTMDVAIRAVNWIWALSIMAERYGEDFAQKTKVQRIFRSLYEHGWFIYNNPERCGKYNHNHYLADLAGQICVGLLFRKDKEGNIWLKEGVEELYSEIRSQILPTGMSYERSMHYDRLVLELVLVPTLLLKKYGYEVPTDVWYRIESMFGFIKEVMMPDGEVPIVGDQDNGRLLPFDDDGNDFRYLMSLGALLFNRPDFKVLGNGYNQYCYYLCFNKSKEDFDRIPNIMDNRMSTAFPDAGFYVMRNKGDYLLFNISGKGLNPEVCTTTHTHSDLLSFVMCINGVQILSDSGTYKYTSDAKSRNLFRSTAMHNTLTVDGFSQNEMRYDNLWDFERNAIPKVIEWETNEQFDRIIASHNGYERLQHPVTHKRTLVYDKNKNEYEIIDDIMGHGYHDINIYFHFDDKIDIKRNNRGVIAAGRMGNIQFLIESPNSFDIMIEDSFISKSYGSKIQNRVMIITQKIKDTTSIKTIITK